MYIFIDYLYGGVTKENMEMYIALRKRYDELKERGETTEKNEEMRNILDVCNDFIENSINKDKMYYSKLSGYGFTHEDLKYCM